MRVLLLSPDYSTSGAVGGIGAYTAELAAGLGELGHEVHVLAWARESRLEQGQPSVTVHALSRWRQRRLFARITSAPLVERVLVAAATARAVRRLGRFDVIEVPDWMAVGALLRFAGRGACRVVHIHGPMVLVTRQYRPDPPRHVRAAEWLERRAVASADVVTSPSASTTEELQRRGWNTRGWEHVPCPVAPRQQSAVPTESLVIGWAGRLDVLKDPSTLLAAVEHLKNEGVGPLHVVLVFDSRSSASSGRLSRYKAEAAERGVAVDFRENIGRAELRAVFEGSRVVAVTSRFEAFSMVAAEALAVGRPVVCTRTCGIAPLVAEAGAGAVFEPGDPVALADALRPFLLDVDVAQAASSAAAALVATTLSTGAVARRREALYEGCVTR